MTRKIAFGLLLLTNALFVYKYGERVSGYGVILGICYLLIIGTLVLFLEHKDLARTRVQWISGTTIVSLTVVALLAEQFIPLAGLNVDRWSVISSFLDALATGDYPYFATSHMGNPPGPMPLYFLIAAPFYWLDQLALLSVAGYLFAIWWMGRKATAAAAGMIFLCLSPFLYWELATRSNVFTYSLLVLIGLEKYVSNQRIRTAVYTGLLLSTRSVFVVAYLIYFVSELRARRSEQWRFLCLSVVAAISFALTFLPFVIIWPASFQEMNPFLVQSTFLVPLYVAVIFVIAAAITSLIVKRSSVLFASGLMLWGCIAVYLSYHVYHEGWSMAIDESKVDISYFLFSVPFLGYAYLLNSRTTTFTASRKI